MKLVIDTEIGLNDKIESDKEVKYIISSKHREKTNPVKSYWVIEYVEELECFINNYVNNHKVDNLTWGFIQDESSLKVLGINTFQDKRQGLGHWWCGQGNQP